MSDPLKYLLNVMEYMDQLKAQAAKTMRDIEQKSRQIGDQLSTLDRTAQEVQEASRGLEAVIATHVATLALLRAERRSFRRILPITAGIVALLLFAAGFIVPVAYLAARYDRPFSEMLSAVFGA